MQGLQGLRHHVAQRLVRVAKRCYRAAPLSADTKWRLARIFFAVTAPLLRTAPIWHTYQKEKAWRERHAALAERDGAGGPEWSPRSASRAHVDLIIWGIIDWEFRVQRPQHLARSLAQRGHRVFYISPLFIDDEVAGFAAEQVDPRQSIYAIRLHAKGRPILQQEPLSESSVAQLTEGLAQCLGWAVIAEAVSIVHQPSWYPLARKVPNARLVYDWIDDHSAFAAAGSHIESIERALCSQADLITASAKVLHRRARERNPSAALIPNAADVESFAKPPSSRALEREERKVLGYYGAIAEWVDVELLRATAERFPDCLLLLIGADTAGVLNALREHPNVTSTREVAYAELPALLHAMDVCLIPFLSTAMTATVNPVKVYEYLAAGKPVVSTDLHELRGPEFEELVYRSRDREEFLANVGIALSESAEDPVRSRRRAFARDNTWDHRAESFLRALSKIREPLVSIVIVAHNQLPLTQRCIASIFDDESYANYELIVVDNASSDGTAEYLRALCRQRASLCAIENSDNRGFAAGVNAGLARAEGEFLVILNNDTLVSRGWLRTLTRHLRNDPAIGLIGPVSNAVDNEARVHVSYASEDRPANAAIEGEAFRVSRARPGEIFEIETLSFFCVMLRRAVHEKVGELDEDYGLGYFEDDDYCKRVRERGLRLCCARDVFVHHHRSASFGVLDEAARRDLFERNRARFESKWGPWQPHKSLPENAA